MNDYNKKTPEPELFVEVVNELMFKSHGNDGGEQHSPIDRPASRTAEEVEFVESRAFEKQFPNRVIADITLTYRINKRNHASVWATGKECAAG